MTWWLLTFARGGPARYLSHLDTARVVQRTFARAGVPLALSQGFRPKPRLSLPLALPVGADGLEELAVAEVTPDAPEPIVSLPLLRAASPPGMEPIGLTVAGERHPRPQPAASVYACMLTGDAGAIAAAVERYGREQQVIHERVSPKGGRRLDLKEYVVDVTSEPLDDGARLGFTVVYRADGAARPQEYVDRIAHWAKVEPVMWGLERRHIDWKGILPAPRVGEGRSESS